MYRVNMFQLQLNGYSTFYEKSGVGKQARSYLQRMKKQYFVAVLSLRSFGKQSDRVLPKAFFAFLRYRR
jgi:hypothetical protein